MRQSLCQVIWIFYVYSMSKVVTSAVYLIEAPYVSSCIFHATYLLMGNNACEPLKDLLILGIQVGLEAVIYLSIEETFFFTCHC